MNWGFFRISGLTVELFRALDRAKSFAIGNIHAKSACAALHRLRVLLVQNLLRRIHHTIRSPFDDRQLTFEFDIGIIVYAKNLHEHERSYL